MRERTCGTRTAARALLFLAFASLAACGGRDRAEKGTDAGKEDEGEPVSGGTAVVAELGDLEVPFPLFFQGEMDSDLVDITYMGLTRGAWRDGRLVYLTSNDSPMAMAWRWEYAGPDSAAIRYRMKSSLRWSDGKPITAHDVVWTYRMFADPAVASPRQQEVARIDSVVAENDSTVVFHFDGRSQEMLFASGLAIVPRHVFESVAPGALRTHPAVTDPTQMVVSGPFRIGAWAPNQQITLVPNPRGPVRPRLDRLVIRIVPEPTTRLAELETGSVDMVKQIAFDQVARLRERASNLRFEAIEKRYWEYVAYNPLRGEPFSDPALRRALGMAVDVPGTIAALGMEDFAVPAAGPFPPIFRDLYDPERNRPLPHAPDSARAALQAAGWVDADGDGVREKAGKRLAFTLLTNTGNQRRADVAQILQRQWREVGADVAIQTLEFNTYQERQVAHEFDALLGSWGVNLNADISPMFTPGSSFNIVSYDDPAAREAMEAAQPTASAAVPHWRAAAEELVRDQPYTWLYFYDVVVGLSDRLKDVRVDSFGAYQNTWEWWIPRGRQGAPAPAPDTAQEGRERE
jgi:peptide/nickel transport system substrate-binding protein